MFSKQCKDRSAFLILRLLSCGARVWLKTEEKQKHRQITFSSRVMFIFFFCSQLPYLLRFRIARQSDSRVESLLTTAAALFGTNSENQGDG